MSKLHAALLSFSVFVFVLLAIGVGFLGYRFFGKKKPAGYATESVPAIISGSILYNSALSLPQDEGLGRIVLYQREIGNLTFEAIPITVPLVSAATWAWSGAESGKTYELVAAAEIQGQEVSRSHSIVVTAPAGREQLVFDDEDAYLPEHLALISDLPSETPQLSAPQYYATPTPTASVVPTPSPSPTATPQLSPSPQPSATPGERAAVLGSIDLNGPVANNSSILILQRKPGETVYTAVVRIPAGDGQTWSYDSAITSSQYEMTAALQVGGNNTSTANAVTVTAPSSGIIFRINTNVSLDAPGKPRLLTCGTRKDGQTKWPAELVFDQVSNANSYWLQVGTAAGKSDAYDERRIRSKSNEEKAIVELENGKEYFVRYAQAQCSNCRADQDYSGFSESVTVKCE